MSSLNGNQPSNPQARIEELLRRIVDLEIENALLETEIERLKREIRTKTTIYDLLGDGLPARVCAP